MDGSDQLTDRPEGRRQRLDKFLWFARVVKTRTLATRLVESGHVRVNSQRTVTPAKQIAPGDVLTISLLNNVRILKMLSAGERRGPFAEARLLFEDLTPASEQSSLKSPSQADPGAPQAARGRPDKRERREGASRKRGL